MLKKEKHYFKKNIIKWNEKNKLTKNKKKIYIYEKHRQTIERN